MLPISHRKKKLNNKVVAFTADYDQICDSTKLFRKWINVPITVNNHIYMHYRHKRTLVLVVAWRQVHIQLCPWLMISIASEIWIGSVTKTFTCSKELKWKLTQLCNVGTCHIVFLAPIQRGSWLPPCTCNLHRWWGHRGVVTENFRAVLTHPPNAHAICK